MTKHVIPSSSINPDEILALSRKDVTSRADRPTFSQIQEGVERAKLRSMQIDNDHNELSKELKQSIVKWVRYVVTSYLGYMGLVITGIMVGAYLDKHLLSDTVLVALLTTTTVNILGLPYLIIRGLFKEKAA